MAEDLKALVEALQRDLEDADEVIGGLGYSRRKCRQCGRRAVVEGYICWHCGADPTMPDERCGDTFEGSTCTLEPGHDPPHSDGEAEWGDCPRAGDDS